MSDPSNTGNDNTDKPDAHGQYKGLTKNQIAFVEKQISDAEKKKAKDEAIKALSNMDSKEAIEALQKENEELKANQKASLLKQFTDEEQEEFKDRSIKELQLLLDYKGKHLKKGILRSQPTDASDKRTSTQMTPGSIGSWDPIKREWK